MSEISRKPARTVTELASAHNTRKGALLNHKSALFGKLKIWLNYNSRFAKL